MRYNKKEITVAILAREYQEALYMIEQNIFDLLSNPVLDNYGRLQQMYGMRVVVQCLEDEIPA